jgi:hypothetical protein
LKQNFRALGVSFDPNVAVGSPSAVQKAIAKSGGAVFDDAETVDTAVPVAPKPIGSFAFSPAVLSPSLTAVVLVVRCSADRIRVPEESPAPKRHLSQAECDTVRELINKHDTNFKVRLFARVRCCCVRALILVSCPP